MSIFIKPIIRSFFKHFNRNVINIIGICLGLTITTLCFLLIQYEFSFDKSYDHADDIYRIIREDKDNNGATSNSQGTSSLLSSGISEAIPEVLHSTRFFNNGVDVHQPNSRDIFNEPIAIVDKEFYQIFSLKFIKGSFETSLNKPFGVVLTREMANRIFKEADPIGKPLTIQGFYFQNLLFEVTGVVEDLPRNTSFNLSMLTTESSFLPDWLWKSWAQTSGYLPVQTYIQVKKGISVTALNTKLNGLIKDHFEKEYQSKIRYHLQPLKRIHLYSQTDYSIGSSGNISYIRFFIILSILILFIVAINFINVSKTLFQRRLIETGVKKVFGSSGWKFVIDFLIETTFLILICLPVVLLLVYLLVPVMNEFLNSNISIVQLLNSKVFFRYVGVLISFIFVIGIVPSFSFSSMKPVMLLSKQAKTKRRKYSNGTLVVVQFCIAIILIISTLHINKQFHYLINKELGFNQKNVIMLPILGNDASLRNRFESVKEAFLQNPAIVSATTSHAVIGTFAEQHNVKPDGHEEINMLGIGVDADYIPFYNLKLLQGRNFRKNSEYDNNSVILNKKAVEALGWKGEAVGRSFEFRGRKGQVIGVVEDFHIFGLDQQIRPAYLQQELPKNWLALRYSSGTDMSQIAQFINDKQVELSPNNIPQMFNLSDMLQGQYESAQRTMQVFGIFAILAIILSCIGLLGVVIEVCQSRVKEVGVRKVNGATIWEVMILLNWNFFRNLLIAYVIAIPLAWYIMHNWLNEFAYKIHLTWWIFVIAGILILVIAVLTVTLQSWRAATRNPVEALRYE